MVREVFSIYYLCVCFIYLSLMFISNILHCFALHHPHSFVAVASAVALALCSTLCFHLECYVPCK